MPTDWARQLQPPAVTQSLCIASAWHLLHIQSGSCGCTGPVESVRLGELRNKVLVDCWTCSLCLPLPEAVWLCKPCRILYTVVDCRM